MLKTLEYSEENLKAVWQIEQECFASEAWTSDMLTKDFFNTKAEFIAYTKNDNVIGYCLYYTMLDEMQIASIAVLKEYRKQGIASQLLNYAEKNARKKGCVVAELEVNCANEPALNLYKKAGFEIAGLRKNFYPKSQHGSFDAFTMIKKF